MSDKYTEVKASKREKFIERIKTKLTKEDLQELYDFFNVDDDVRISMEHGVEALTPFGADGPSLEKHGSLEMYALDKYARQFAQQLVRVRFNQLIDPKKDKEVKEKKTKTPK